MKVPAKCRICGKDLLLEVVPNDLFRPETLACIAICNPCQDQHQPEKHLPPVKPSPPPAAPEPPPRRLPYSDE